MIDVELAKELGKLSAQALLAGGVIWWGRWMLNERSRMLKELEAKDAEAARLHDCRLQERKECSAEQARLHEIRVSEAQSAARAGFEFAEKIYRYVREAQQ